MVEIRGFLHPFFETGTEGIIWSILDPGLPGYDGWVSLSDGDELRVLNDRAETLWEGIVRLDYVRGLDHTNGGSRAASQQAVLGCWVHGLQADLDPEFWAEMFFARRRVVGQFRIDASRRTRFPHPFQGPAAGMESRLRSLSEDRARELFRAALGAWLVIFTDGNWQSIAKDWSINFQEILTLIGDPTPQQLAAYATYPQNPSDTLMPFNLHLLVRLGILFQLNAILLWEYNDPISRAAWLTQPHHRLGDQAPLHLLQTGDVPLMTQVLEVAHASCTVIK